MTITTDGIVLSEQRYIVIAIKFPASILLSFNAELFYKLFIKLNIV
jgi:hypothetical protein